MKDILREIKNRLDKHNQKDIAVKTRKRDVVNLRALYTKIAMDVSDEYDLNLSLNTIGSVINRDHATIIHYRDNITQWIMKEEKYRMLYNRIFPQICVQVEKVLNLQFDNDNKTSYIVKYYSLLEKYNRLLKNTNQISLLTKELDDLEMEQVHARIRAYKQTKDLFVNA